MLWCGILVWLSRAVVQRGGDFMPFVIFGVCLVLLIVLVALGGMRVHLDRGQCRVFPGIGPPGRTKDNPIGKDILVSLEESRVRVNNEPLQEIVVRTADHTVGSGAFLDPAVRRFVAAAIRKACGG